VLFLLSYEIEKHHVFRAALLSIFVSLAAGQNAVVLVCRAWCDLHAATASECHHGDLSTAPGVDGGGCGDMVAVVAAVIREDPLRDISVGANQAIPRYQLAQSMIDARPGREARCAWSVEERPLATVLRL